MLILSGCNSTIIKTLLPPPKDDVSSDINAGKNITLEVLDANSKPLRNAWYKSYCTNEQGIVTFPYSSLNGENSIELKVYNSNGESKSHSGIIDTTSDLPETPIKILTSLKTQDNSDLLPRIQIQVKALNADSIYVRCYSQEENRPQTTGFVCSKRVIGKCQFDDVPFHEGFVDGSGVFNVPCVQYGEHFAEVTIYHGDVKTSHFFNFNVESLSTETVFVADTRNVATGYSLEKLGYTADFSTVRVRDANNPYKKNVPVNAVSVENPLTSNSDIILKGDYTAINANPYVKDSEQLFDIPIMLLQGFKKSEYKKYKFIEAGDLLYNASDLDKYKIFEDDNIIVYDMRFLVQGNSLNESIRLAGQNNYIEADIEWLDKVYFRLTAKPFIKAIPPDTNSSNEN